ncbi:MAG: glycosyltransferase family 4 protein, partial [Acidimicrobiales bacterium]
MTAVHQFVPNFASGDAIGLHVRNTQAALRRAGYRSDIFYDDVQASVKHLGRPYTTFEPTRGDWIIYHLSTGSRIVETVFDAGCDVGVYFHNITPAAYFERWAPGAAVNIREARSEMRRLASVSKFAMANSSFSETELKEDGFANTAVVPVLIDFSDYDTPPHSRRLSQLEDDRRSSGARWLFVSRLAPNKCQHDVIGAFALYRAVHDPKATLTIIGGKTADIYYRSLQVLIDELDVADSVELTDTISFPELLAYYRTSDVFVCLSEHEGFMVPLLEAMHFGVPVVAYARTAVPETL